MNIIVSIAILSGVVLLASLWAWFVLWHELFVDKYRQRLFKTRDELFDKAQNEEIPFDSEEYRGLRELLNGMIRFAHTLTPFSLLLIAVLRNRLFPLAENHFADPRIKLASENYPSIHEFVSYNSAFLTIGYFVRSSMVLRVVFQILLLSKITQARLAKRIEPLMDEVGAAGKIEPKLAA